MFPVALPSPKALPRRTLVDLAYESVREAIVFGALKPGQRINQDEIAARLDVSRMPLREALRMLGADGLVRLADHRGAFVADLTSHEMEEIYVIRECLESAAVRLGCEMITPQGIETLREMLIRMGQIQEAGDFRSLVGVNRAFHLTIYAASGYPGLCSLIERMYDRALRYRLLFTMDAEHARQTVREHEDLLGACERRCPALAEEVVRMALRLTRDTLASVLAAKTPDSPPNSEVEV